MKYILDYMDHRITESTSPHHIDSPKEHNNLSHVIWWKLQKLMFKRCCQDSESILDYGCGIGRWSTFFPDKKYVGYDISPKVLKIAKDINGSKFVNELNDIFDSCICFNVLSMCYEHDAFITLSDIHSYLKAKSFLYVTVCDSKNVYFAKKLKWASLFQNTGFELISIKNAEFTPLCNFLNSIVGIFFSRTGELDKRNSMLMTVYRTIYSFVYILDIPLSLLFVGRAGFMHNRHKLYILRKYP